MKASAVCGLVVVALLGAMGGGSPVLAADPPPRSDSALAGLKAVYDQQAAKIESEYAQNLGALDARYPRDLNTLKGRAQQAGNLNGVMALDAEMRRFESERSIPDAAPPGLPDDLLALQAAHRKARADVARDRGVKTLALVNLYLQRLEDMKKSLTMAGKLDEALAVNTEVERVKASPAVMAADFAAAAAGDAAAAGVSVATNAAAAAGPAVADLKLPAGVKVYEGNAPGADSVTMKSQSLSPTSRARLARKLAASVSMGESGGPSRSSYSSMYSSSSSQSGTTTHHVRIGLRSASTQYRFGGGTLVVQYFAKDLGSQGKAVPRLSATQSIPLPAIEVSKPVTVDCAPVLLYSRSYKYRSYYGGRYSSESGMDLYGLAVSVFESDGTLAYQAASSTSLDALAIDAAPPGAGVKIVDDGGAEVQRRMMGP